MPRSRIFVPAVAALLFIGPAAAEESAADISRKSRDRGALDLLDLAAELRLTTRGKDGAAKVQVLSLSAKKVDGRTRALSRFISPPQVAGVGVLTIEGAEGAADEIFLYLPKLKRVRRVAQAQRSHPFMDTDFSYADLGNAGARDETVKRLADQVFDGRPTFVLRGAATDSSPYGEVTVYVDQQTYVPLKASYSDKAGAPFKEYRTLKLKVFEGRTLAGISEMENVQTGSKTTLELLKLNKASLGDEAFTERALERG